MTTKGVASHARRIINTDGDKKAGNSFRYNATLTRRDWYM